MNRTWLIILVAAGIGLAVIVGVLGTRNDTTKSEATASLCTSLQSLDTSLTNLTNLGKSASKDDYQNNVSAVQNDWSQVKTDAQNVQSASMGDLDSAWNSFTSAVKNVPSDASAQDAVSDVTQSADQLVSTAKSTASEINCS